MNEITIQQSNIPSTIEDLTQFVLVGKAKLQAYMLKLQTVNKLSTAQEIRDQTLKEAQEVSTALIAAEQRIGELLLAMPTAQGLRRDITSATRSDEVKTKSETISEMGYDRHEASDYQRMAKNPEVVQRVIDEAIANGEVVTKTQVMKEIKAVKAESERLKEQIRELQNAEPETVEVEVVPEDYEALKEEAKRAKKETEAYKADYRREQERHGKTRQKLVDMEFEIKELEKRLATEQLHGDLLSGATYFIAQCGSFIRDVSGYVWIADKLVEIPEKERIGYIKAARAVHDWASVLLQNIERDKEYGKPELLRIASESTAEQLDRD